MVNNVIWKKIASHVMEMLWVFLNNKALQCLLVIQIACVIIRYN